MRLLDLLYKIHEFTTIWVSTSENSDDAIYFDEAGKMPVGIARKYEVVEFYVEKYPARFCTGISIIVK